MELFDIARNKNLNPITILKVFITHEENLRNSFFDYCKQNIPNFNTQEENLFDFIDSHFINFDNQDDLSERKKKFNDFSYFVDEFFKEESILSDGEGEYKIGFNRRIEADLKPFCYNESLASTQVMKAKAPTISNTEFNNNLNIKDVFEKEQTFNVAAMEILTQFKEPSMKKDAEGIEYMVANPIIRYEELNGNEVVNGEIKISLDPVPLLRSSEYIVLEKDLNGNVIGSKRLDFKNSVANKENVLKGITEYLSGIYATEAIGMGNFPIEGKVLFAHKLDYAKLKKYQENPLEIPSYSYEINKDGLITIEFDDNFMESYKTYFNLSKIMTCYYGGKKQHELVKILEAAQESFNSDLIRDKVNIVRENQKKAFNLLTTSVNIEETLNDLGIKDFEKQIFVLQFIMSKYLENEQNELSNQLLRVDEKQNELIKKQLEDIKTVKDNLLNFIKVNEIYLDETAKEATKNFILVDLCNDFCDSLAKLKSEDNLNKSYKAFNIEMPKFYRMCNLTKEAKIDYAIDKAFNFSYKANHGSLRNDRTHERRVLENISRVQKELGISPEKLTKIYLSRNLNLIEQNIQTLKDITTGINENIDFQNRNELPIININSIPEKTAKRVISYDIETGGLKAETDGVSQFTAMVVDYDQNNKIEKMFFVDEYVNPEQNPLPIIGENEEGFIFGSCPEGVYGFTEDGEVLTNDNYHILKTQNPDLKIYDEEQNLIKFLYPQQNVGAVDTHGISNESLVKKPTFRDILPGVQKLMNSSDSIIGFNTIKFDNNFLIGLAKKNGLELDIESKKNVDLKRLTGDLFTYSQVKNNLFDVYINTEKLNIENNERFYGKTLNALAMMTLTSLEARYVTGEEVHDAKADTLITYNLAKNTYDICEMMKKDISKLIKEFQLESEKLRVSEIFDETSFDSRLLLSLNTFKDIERIYSKNIANVAMERQLENLSKINPSFSNLAISVLNKDSENNLNKINKKSNSKEQLCIE